MVALHATIAIIRTMGASRLRSSGISGVIQRTTQRCRIFENWPLGICMKVNDKAPEFTLPDENGKDVSLEDLRGKTVILFFYPRASTPG